MSNLRIRNISEDDYSLLRYLAEKCKPLDVHTLYTYWVLSKFFSGSSFLLFDNNTVIGYITSVETEKTVFIWQIGVLEEYRSLGYSRVLIAAVSDYAINKKKNMAVSIAGDNERSFNAFKGFCNSHSYQFKESGILSLRDLTNVDFNEEECFYDIIINEEWANCGDSSDE